MKNIRIAKIVSKVAARLSAAALLAVLAGTLHAADWVYDNGTLSDGVWTFNAQLSGTKVTLTAFTLGPSMLTDLDFTKPIKDTSDNALSITYFGRLFESPGNTALRPYVGELKLPASGYTGIGRNAFSGCANATGTISFPAELNGLEGGSAFNGDSGITIVGNSFPEGLKTITPDAFNKCKIQGDVELPGVETIQQGAFANTDIRSVSFGPSLTKMENYSGSGANGAFQNCASLESVYIDPESSVTITHGKLFSGCSSLTEIDLSGVVHIEQNADNLGHFSGCTNLRKVTFGSKLDYLDGRIFNGATKLEQVIFKGPPPATIANIYLLGAGNGGEVTTYVILDENATDYDYATAKAAWDALTAGGEINEMDSTWKADYIGDAPASTRHLLLYEIEHVSIEASRDADEGEGVVGTFTVSRGAGESVAGPLVVNYTVGGTAVAGQTYGALSGSVTIPAGSTSGTIEIVPLDDTLTAEDTTVVITLSSGDYEIVAGRETATVNIVNGASYPGWKYTITGDNAGTMSKDGWSFSATHSGRDLTVGAVTAYPADISPLDFSAIVAGSDGHAYTIVRLGSSDNGLGLAGDDPGNVPKPSESGYRVGLLTLPGEGLVSICPRAFACCTNTCGVLVVPSSLTAIGDAAFRFSQVSGDLSFPALQRLTAATFQKTKITSVSFSSALEGIWGGWDRGPFHGCSSLTNIVFDPASKITLGSQGFIFRNCTALRDLDLSCVTNIAYENCGSNFDGCSSLTNITFGAGLTKLPANTFASASALQSIHFKGAAPVIVGGSVENGGLFAGVGGSQTIKTYVSVKYADVKNSANLSWKDYVDGGMLGKSSTHWKNDYLFSGADATHFPLLRIDGRALIIYVR